MSSASGAAGSWCSTKADSASCTIVPRSDAPGSAPSEEALKAALRETLSSYKVPRRIVFISHDGHVRFLLEAL